MKKKVRYALGAAGAVPALGMMMPAAAAATAHAPKTTAKTVSLQHSSAAASGCTGTIEAHASMHSVHLEFWHTDNPTYGTTCIGTVKTVFSRPLYSHSYDRVRIYAHYLNGTKYRAYSRHIPGSGFGVYRFSLGVHRSFGYLPVQVCTAGIDSFGRAVMGPLCKSVG